MQLRDWTLSCYVVNTSNDTKRVTTDKNKKGVEGLHGELIYVSMTQQTMINAILSLYLTFKNLLHHKPVTLHNIRWNSLNDLALFQVAECY